MDVALNSLSNSWDSPSSSCSFLLTFWFIFLRGVECSDSEQYAMPLFALSTHKTYFEILLKKSATSCSDKIEIHFSEINISLRNTQIQIIILSRIANDSTLNIGAFDSLSVAYHVA